VVDVARGQALGEQMAKHESPCHRLAMRTGRAASANVRATRDLIAPVVVGGTGGSGTRAVARVLMALGVNMGRSRNPSEDELSFAAFDWRWGRELLATHLGDSGRRDAEPVAARQAFAELLRSHGERASGCWGWKHPHSYLLLRFLHGMSPGLRFVHVVRDGRDMALSGNQRQLKRYGSLLLGPEAGAMDSPARSATFWSRANCFAADTADAQPGMAYLCVRFEDLCADPIASIRRLAQFADVDQRGAAAAAALVTPPTTLGRWRNVGPSLASTLEHGAKDGLMRFGYVSRTSPPATNPPD
jgi:sulfotransferase family protein